MDLASIIFEDEYNFLDWKQKGVGTGYSKTGQRKKWKKKYFFEQDLLAKYSSELDSKAFKATFAGYSAAQITWFFNEIKQNAIRPKETEHHCRNKLLMWLDKLHNCLSYQQIKDKYHIGITTAKSHSYDVLKSILKTFRGSGIISLPTIPQRVQMVQLLKRRGVPMPDALFSLDGSHTRCTGRGKRERISHKYHWLPCFNVLFLIERALGTICAINLDPAARKHDLTVLREAWFFENLDELMDGWVILADKGYVGHQKKCIAAILKRKMKQRNKYSKHYWEEISVARSEVERVFGDFFSNKFTQLGRWQGKSKDTFIEFAANVISCVVLYNSIKLKFKKTTFLLKSE